MNKAIRIDGKTLADKILETLSGQIKEMKDTKRPQLEVFFIGDNPASKSYINQKVKAAERIGATLHVQELPTSITDEAFSHLLDKAASDKTITGIIIQRPLPPESLIRPKTLLRVPPEKDVDGFVPKTRFEVPVAKAVVTILEEVYRQKDTKAYPDFLAWLRGEKVVILGKGETAGKPIMALFEKLSVSVNLVDRSTPNPNEIITMGTIIISCVGKPGIINHENCAKDAILISVGITRFNGKLVGDYNEDVIGSIASFYTPTPGGVGPVNVACLMQNLVEACKLKE